VPAPSGEASPSEFVTTLPRRAHPGRYSAHNGVARHPGSTALDNPRPQLGRRPPPHPADLAQSRLFEVLLLSEIDELEDWAAAVERRWNRRCERNPHEVTTMPHELKELRERLTEARRLLRAMRTRFPPD
jgi:hypothetical protein